MPPRERACSFSALAETRLSSSPTLGNVMCAAHSYDGQDRLRLQWSAVGWAGGANGGHWKGARHCISRECGCICCWPPLLRRCWVFLLFGRRRRRPNPDIMGSCASLQGARHPWVRGSSNKVRGNAPRVRWTREEGIEPTARYRTRNCHDPVRGLARSDVIDGL